ncbi:MAG: alcohol dehydrogenase, partial [Lentisphaerae bacterium]|nr:alcohol dehydrogenase [Lentisphaerota bacterium]
MRAAKLVELKKIEIVDVPVPDIASDTDVQVQVKAVG